MNILGDITTGHKINKVNNGKYVWVSCEICGKERWVALVVKTNQPLSKMCQDCTHDESRKLGTTTTWGNYEYISLPKNSPYISMTKSNTTWVKVHRLVMAQSLGRPLQCWEVVHHINGNKKDNHLENLELLSDTEHKQITSLQSYIKELEAKIILLESKNG